MFTLTWCYLLNRLDLVFTCFPTNVLQFWIQPRIPHCIYSVMNGSLGSSYLWQVSRSFRPWHWWVLHGSLKVVLRFEVMLYREGQHRGDVPFTLYRIIGMWCQWAALVMFLLWFQVVSARFLHFPYFLWKWIINSSPHSRGGGSI